MAETFIYFIKPVGMDGPIKIGCSAVPLSRLTALMTWCPFDLELLARAPGGYAEERRLGFRFREHWLRAEWYRPAPPLTALIAEVGESGSLPFSTVPLRRYRLSGLPAIISRHGLSIERFAEIAEMAPATVRCWMRYLNGPECVGHALAVLEELGIAYPFEALIDGPEPQITRRGPRARRPKAERFIAEHEPSEAA